MKPRFVVVAGAALLGVMLLFCVFAAMVTGRATHSYPSQIVGTGVDGQGTEMVIVRDDGPGFLPFFAIPFGLILIGGAIYAFRTFASPDGQGPRGPWSAGGWSSPDRQARFEEWHRQAHASDHAPVTREVPDGPEPPRADGNPIVRL